MEVVNRRYLIIRLLMSTIALASPGLVCPARGAPSTPDARAGRREYLTHCGLYCLYVTLRIAGKNINYEELVQPEYYGSYRGSSLLELKKAAEDHGLYATPIARLTTRDLRRSPYPMILHVKSAPEVKDYDHYELFLNAEGEKARVVAPPDVVGLIAFRDLVARWDGNGLLVSARPIDPSFIYKPRYARMAVYGLIGACILLAGRYARRPLTSAGQPTRRWLLRSSAAHGMALVLLAFFLGFIHHFGRDAGFLVHPSAVQTLQKAYAGNFLPKVSAPRVAHLLGHGTVFIDARLARDYQNEHLVGALSVPVDANDVVRHERVKGIPLDAPVVVYCQSASCKFAEKVALQLRDDGFSRVSVFRAGWAEWVRRHKDGITGRTPERNHATDGRV